MKTLKSGSRLSPILLQIGYFISPTGGSVTPFRIPRHRVLVEWLTHGPIFHPETGEEVPAGSIFLHREGDQTVSRCLPDSHYECMTALFDVEADPLSDACPRYVGWPEEEGGVSFARDMVFRHHHTRLGVDVLGPLIWAQLSYRVVLASRASQKVPRRISASLQEMERRYAEPLQMEALADQVGLSPSHFHARFKEVMEMTPHRYLVQLRMRAARHRLVTTSDPIKAISFDVGYANAENFCRAFKKETGMTAAQFRDVHQAFPSSPRG